MSEVGTKKSLTSPGTHTTAPPLREKSLPTTVSETPVHASTLPVPSVPFTGEREGWWVEVRTLLTGASGDLPPCTKKQLSVLSPTTLLDCGSVPMEGVVQGTTVTTFGVRLDFLSLSLSSSESLTHKLTY